MSYTPAPDKDGVRWYGCWAGNPKGQREDTARCVAEVSDKDPRWPHHSQCSRPRGHGPDGLYCKQHDPEAVKRRHEARKKRWDDEWAAERAARERPIRAARIAALLEAAEALEQDNPTLPRAWRDPAAAWLRERAEKEGG